MNTELVIKDFIEKRKNDPKYLEIIQLENLLEIYDPNSVQSAIKRAENGSIKKIGYYLMRMAGFPDDVPDCLKSVILSHHDAGNLYSASQIKVAESIRKQIIIPDDKNLLNLIVDLADHFSVLQIWEECVGSYSSDKELLSQLCDLIRIYGIRLVLKMMDCFPLEVNQSRADYIVFMREWLRFASERDWDKLFVFLKTNGINDDSTTWGIPYACPHRLSQYFYAKTGRQMSPEECVEYWKLFHIYSENDIIFSMSYYPGKLISPDKVDWFYRLVQERQNYYLNPESYEAQMENYEKQLEKNELNYSDPLGEEIWIVPSEIYTIDNRFNDYYTQLDEDEQDFEDDEPEFESLDNCDTDILPEDTY